MEFFLFLFATVFASTDKDKYSIPEYRCYFKWLPCGTTRRFRSYTVAADTTLRRDDRRINIIPSGEAFISSSVTFINNPYSVLFNFGNDPGRFPNAGEEFEVDPQQFIGFTKKDHNGDSQRATVDCKAIVKVLDTIKMNAKNVIQENPDIKQNLERVINQHILKKIEEFDADKLYSQPSSLDDELKSAGFLKQLNADERLSKVSLEIKQLYGEQKNQQKLVTLNSEYTRIRKQREEREAEEITKERNHQLKMEELKRKQVQAEKEQEDKHILKMKENKQTHQEKMEREKQKMEEKELEMKNEKKRLELELDHAKLHKSIEMEKSRLSQNKELFNEDIALKLEMANLQKEAHERLTTLVQNGGSTLLSLEPSA